MNMKLLIFSLLLGCGICGIVAARGGERYELEKGECVRLSADLNELFSFEQADDYELTIAWHSAVLAKAKLRIDSIRAEQKLEIRGLRANPAISLAVVGSIIPLKCKLIAGIRGQTKFRSLSIQSEDALACGPIELSHRIIECADEKDYAAGWIAYAKALVKKLNVPKADEAQLDPLFRRIPNGLAIHRMTRERGKYAAAFKRFLVSFVEELRRTGDDPEGAVYLNMLLATSPPELILEAIAPELEAGGRLEGALDGENNDIAKSIQNQHQQSHPDFSVYARYLSGKDIAESPALIRHLMQTDPHQALQVLLSVRYNVPFPPTGKRQSRYGDGKALLFAQHLARDVMFHEEFGFELGPERLEKAKQVLREIAERDEWWVRRYLATVMSRSEALKDAEVLERVQESAER